MSTRRRPMTLDQRDAVNQGIVRCHTIGHSWDPIPVTTRPMFGVAIELRCVACTTVRRDIVSPFTGELLTRRYTYPEGYRHVGRITRPEWRTTWLPTLDRTLVSESDELTTRRRPRRATA